MLLIFSSETDIEATAYEHPKTKVEKLYTNVKTIQVSIFGKC